MSNSPQAVRQQADAQIGSPSCPLQTKMRQGSGEVSEHRSGFTSDQRWLDMTPKTRKRDRYELGLPVLLVRLRIQGVVANSESRPERSDKPTNKMTLCGSEVPQDRWRGRTAGSGMWTLTRDYLLSWSLDDPAIPYG